MDFNKEELKVFYYPLFSGWKNPLLYIFFLLAMGLYACIFYFHRSNEVLGTIERTKEMKVFLTLIVTVFLFHLFRSAQLVQKVDLLIFRSLLLIGAISIAFIFMLPAWMFNKYDNQVMNTYMRILPFNASPYIKAKNTLLFRDIKAIEYNSGGDVGGRLRFLLNNGQKQALGLGNISSKSRDVLLITLYDECNWLQEGIEKQFGSIEKRRVNVESKRDYENINIFHFLLNTFFLWMILAQITCLVVYTFKINFKL